MKEIQFPIKYYEGNKIFAHDNSSWAYFKMDGYEYDYLSLEQKLRISRNLSDFVAAIKEDAHLLIVPQFYSIEEAHDDYKKKITGDLKEAAFEHLDQSVEPIEQNIGTEASDDHYYIGIKLPSSEFDTKDMKGMVEQLKKLKNNLFNILKLEDADITKEEYERTERKAKSIEELLNANLKGVSAYLQPVDERDIQWLIKRNFFRSIGKTEIIDDFKPTAETDEKGKRVYAPELLRLTEGIVDDEKIGQIAVTQMVKGQEKTGYTSFLTISNMPEEMLEVGTEWIYLAQNLDFPVETSIRTHSIDHIAMKKQINNKKQILTADREHAESSNNEAPLEIQENEMLVRELEQNTKKNRKPTIEVSVVFAVSADTEDVLQNRVKVIVDEFADLNIEVVQPGSDQWKLFNEFIPASPTYVKDYIHMMEPAYVGAGMFGATKNIGDQQGFFMGVETHSKAPVRINPSLAAQGIKGTKTKNLSTALLGPPGGGKSFASNLICYLSALGGGKALIVDPKGERSNWPEDLKFIKGHVNVVTLTSDYENKGRLDPFMICSTREEAKSLAIGVLTFLVQKSFEHDEFMLISDAVEEVSEMDTPCMDKVVEILLNSDDEAAVKIGNKIRVFTTLSFAKLLFGDGKTHQQLSMEYAINILQIQNMKMPPKTKSLKNYSLEEMLSMALMFPIGHFAHDFMHNLPRHIFKIIFFDESWFLEKTDIGTDIIDRLTREGRYMNAGIYRATQAMKDIDDERKSMIGMKFVFQSNDVEECKAYLRFLGLDENDQDNIQTIQNLEMGQCLFQDIKGRTARIQIQHLFKDLEVAFDTRPPAEMEEETEEKTEEETEKRNQELLHV